MNRKPQTQVRILIYRTWAILDRVTIKAWRQLFRARNSPLLLPPPPLPLWVIDHHTGDSSPTLNEQCQVVCGFVNVQGQVARAKVYRPYPRRQESLTVCRCFNKDCIFCSVILRSWVLVRPGFELTRHRVEVINLREWNWLSFTILFALQVLETLLFSKTPWYMQSFQKHLKTIVDAKFGERTECCMGDSKLENNVKVYVFIFSCFSKSYKINLDRKFF